MPIAGTHIKPVCTNSECYCSSSNDLENMHSGDECHSVKSISVTRVREELQNVIEKMDTNMKTNRELDTEEPSVSLMKSTTSDDISAMSSLQEESITTEYIRDVHPKKYSYNYGSTEVAVQTSEYKLICPRYLRPEVNSPCICTHAQNYNTLPQNGFTRTPNFCENKKRTRLDKLKDALTPKNSSHRSKYTELYRLEIEKSPMKNTGPRTVLLKVADEKQKPVLNDTGINTHQVTHYVKHEKVSKGMHAHVYKNENKNVNVEVNTNIKEKKEEKPEEPKHEKTFVSEMNSQENIDIYYFDHGNSEYYRTTDCAPVIMTEILAQRTEHYTKKFWAQVFGTLHIGVSFVTSFFLQLFRFILYAIIRPLLIGFTQLFSDYFIKPCLATIFNSLIQPVMIFLYNIATSIRDVCHPIAQTFGYFIREIAVLIRSFRLFDISNRNNCIAKKENTTCK